MLKIKELKSVINLELQKIPKYQKSLILAFKKRSHAMS